MSSARTAGNPINAIVETVVDAGQDPEAKAKLLTAAV